MDISAIALQGLQQADTQLNEAASNIASLGAGSSAAANLDTANFSAAALSLISAQTQSSVNLATLKVADEVQKSLIDVMA